MKKSLVCLWILLLGFTFFCSSAFAQRLAKWSSKRTAVANFYADSISVIKGDTINFTSDCKGKIRSYFWTFSGGTPSSSEDKNPSIKYDIAGTYSVSLTIVNLKGLTDTQTKTSYIIVDAQSAAPIDYLVVDTQQSACFDGDGAQISCPLSGESFYGQDAQYISLVSNYTDNGDGTVTDNNTGLMWQQNPGDKMSFAAAKTGATTCELSGYNDWRFPTVKELYSLINFSGQTGNQMSNDETDGSWILYIDDDYFVHEYGDTGNGDRTIDGQTWSATEYVSTTMNGDQTVFGVNFCDGRIKGYPKYDPRTGSDNVMFSRYVRGNTNYGANNFTDNNDGIVIDHATGLMWAKNDSGVAYDWESALEYAENLTLSGYSDWRLPNAKELQSIVDYTKSPDTTNSPAIDDTYFNTTQVTWTSACDGTVLTNYPYFWASSTHLEFGPGDYGNKAVYLAFGEALGYMNGSWMDVHGAGSQRSDPKAGDPESDTYVCGFGPQGDYISIKNFVRVVRDAN
ncbi:MAG: DUF1566 domain-containing protein [Desulfobacteraceae bacterium]|nr:DUF1566 domain-containing protein [Desulfobacteraceae bacterium]